MGSNGCMKTGSVTTHNGLRTTEFTNSLMHLAMGYLRIHTKAHPKSSSGELNRLKIASDMTPDETSSDSAANLEIYKYTALFLIIDVY